MNQVSTFAQMEQRVEQSETTTAATATNATETSTATAQASQAAEQATTATATEQQPTATTTTTTTETKAAEQAAQEPEINSSSFSTLLEGEQPAATTEQTATTTQAQPAIYNWKEELKKIDKKELFSELGLNDFVVELNDHIARGGKPVDYLNARAVDYNAFADESIIKADLKKQYPNLSESQISLVFNRKYNVSEDATDEEREFQNTILMMDAKGIRDRLVEEQKKFKIPDAIQVQENDPEYLAYKKQIEDYPRLLEENKNFYLTHEATKTLNESKRVAISFGNDVPAFNFNVDQPEGITRALTDGGETWRKLTSTKTGEPDVQKQQLITLFSYNPQKFCEDIFNYGQQMAKRKIVSEAQNAQRPQANVVPFNADSKPTYSTGKYADKQR